MNEDKKRLYWIDLLRIIATLCVVLCHSTEEGVYLLDVDSVGKIQCFDKVMAFVFFTIGRLGVPFFLLISGYLLLNTEYDSNKTKRFMKKNWLHMLIVTVIWILIYDIFITLIRGQKITVLETLLDILFLHKVRISHIWYMPMLLGFYPFIPFISNALVREKIYKNMFIPMIVGITVIMILPIIYNIINSFDISINSQTQMSDGFIGGFCGIYLLTGGFIKKGVLNRFKSGTLIVFSTSSFICAVASQLWFYSMGQGINIWYDSPFLFVCTISVFELISRIDIIRFKKSIAWLSSYSFAIFLIHIIIKEIFVNSIINLALSKPFQVLELWLICLLISLGIAYIISCIPGFGNYIIYRKIKK